MSDGVTASKYRFGAHLVGVGRCPHCGIANPSMVGIWASNGPSGRATPGLVYRWAVYACTSCGGAVLTRGRGNENNPQGDVTALFPPEKTAHEDIPNPARRFLQQAYETLHAPDAAAVMAGSAVDAMLKGLGYNEGSLYSRIDKAVEDHKLTKAMGDWAHEVRLGSNRPRHADKDKPHVSAHDAKQSVEFVEALGYFLFVLSKRIERGMEEAKKEPSRKISKAPPPMPRLP